jgi:hypothetical protein
MHVGLGVPQIEVAGAALQIEQDHAFGPLPARAASRSGFLCGDAAQAQEVRQAQSERGRTANSQQFTPRESIAGGTIGPGRNYEHGLNLP